MYYCGCWISSWHAFYLENFKIPAYCVIFSDAAEVIQTRMCDVVDGKHEFYVHYDGCKYM